MCLWWWWWELLELVSVHPCSWCQGTEDTSNILFLFCACTHMQLCWWMFECVLLYRQSDMNIQQLVSLVYVHNCACMCIDVCTDNCLFQVPACFRHV